MPELPEVETIVRDLDRMVRGATIEGVEVLRPDLLRGDPAAFVRGLRGRRLETVTRRAKNIVIGLGADRLVVNLGMTGNLLALPAGTPIPPYVGVRFDLGGGRVMVYRDVRRFGRLEVLSEEEWAVRDAALGVEPLSEEFTGMLLHRLTRGSRVAIKVWLMDQKRVVGVGNIYASEALWRARIDPRRRAESLTRPRAGRLVDGIRAVLSEAIEFRGTTLLDYRDVSGEEGSFADRLKVYDRAGSACLECGTVIRRIVQGGRSTFFCPNCQK